MSLTTMRTRVSCPPDSGDGSSGEADPMYESANKPSGWTWRRHEDYCAQGIGRA